ncbi:hypothetical protein K432DRAFT_381519 [Lepidopterella palustris CBS 459.81]|uniref:Uncharacterized protein n=1 Tax=Lepidopterella palustris CBS 459.81 TaxID=1314670 RepID=A0A8E2EC36_9PEZI|nr:hypothetical protein K432DRAFT_381519 [Lepidopterella palustris CBS 459.81]
MSRLRHEEQARIYERMLSPHPETFPPTASPLTWDSRTPFSASKDSSEDEITYADVNRQLILIINVIVSIIACSVFMWVAARRWSTPRRLALSMVTSILVAMAEVVIYAGYIRRVKEAKIAEKKRPEVKEVAWVIRVGSLL